MNNRHTGSDFDSFLDEENLRVEVESAAIKRIIAWQIESAMKQAKISKTAMARKMSRPLTM